MPNNEEAVVLKMAQDPSGLFLYIIAQDTGNQNSYLLLVNAETLKTLLVSVVNEQQPFTGLSISHYEIQDIELHQYKLNSLVAHQGYLVMIVCGNAYYKALLHVATEKKQEEEEKEEPKKAYEHKFMDIARK